MNAEPFEHVDPAELRPLGKPAPADVPRPGVALTNPAARIASDRFGIPIQPGMVLGPYEIVRELGSGGMAVVYLARDLRLGRLVAIKFLLGLDGPKAKRFLAEARTTAQCRHENIVVIYDVGEFHGCPFMVLEYIQGRTLRDVLRQTHAMAVDLAVEHMIPVARALACAHQVGIIHRDLKPENIMLADNGVVTVLDFGIAKQVSIDISVDFTTAPIVDDSSSNTFSTTDDSLVMGTLPYMSPEQWRDEPLDGRTDIWAFGIILFELSTNRHPLDVPSARQLATIRDLDKRMPSLLDKCPNAGAIASIVDRCLEKRREQRFGSALELLSALESVFRKPSEQTIDEEQSPFAGLSAFQELDASRFFGRDRDVFAVMSKLHHNALVAVAGPSGSGKSSFVRAGLIPAVKRTQREMEAFITRPGRHPLEALADVVASCADNAADIDETDPLRIADVLRTQPGRLGATLRARCRKRNPSHRITLFVDQFEELYTLGSPPDERAAFYACLEGIADETSSPLRVIVTIRSDFLDRVTEDRHFLTTMTRGLVLLPHMATEQQREAFKKPLEALRYRFEDETLLDEMLEALAGTKTPLPLLQFTATRCWEARDRERRLLTRQAYLEIGGVAGALSTHADAVLAGMGLSEQRLARTIFLRLVTPERTRAIVRLDELGALFDDVTAVERVMHNLAEARLLSIETSGEREGTTVELTHESLVAGWGKLRAWIDENENDIAFLAELRNAAAQWEKNGHAEGVLWRDRAAVQAGEWLERRKSEFGTKESLGIGKRELHYLNAVVQLEQRTRRRRRQFVGALFVIISAIAVVVSALAIDARAQAKRADVQAIRADEEAKHAQTEARDARNAARIAFARELQAKDPTAVLAIARELEPGPIPRGWDSLALWAIHAGVAETVVDHKDVVQTVSFSADGQWLAVGAWDKTVRIGNADGTGELRSLAGHKGRVYAVAFSPNSKRIASASADSTVRIWNMNGQDEPLVLAGHTQVVTTVAWSPDGKRVVSAGVDKTVRIWNVDGSGQTIVLQGHTDRVNSVAFSPDNTHIVSGAWDNTLRVWNADGSGQPLVLQGHSSRVHSVAYSPDGTRIASGAMDKTIRIWNADGSGQPLVLEGHTDRVAAVAFTPDGQRIASASTDRTVRVWNANGTGQPIVFEGHGQRVDGIAVSPDGKRVASAASDNTVRFWNIMTNALPNFLRGHRDVVEMAVFSPDGRRIVSASADKTVRVWNADGSGIPVVFHGHTSDAICAAFGPDGKQVVSGSADKTVQVWNADGTGEPLVLQGHKSTVQMVGFSPDGKQIVSASNDMTVRVWNADGTGNPIVLQGHKDVVASAVFSHDGQRVLSGSWDKTVRVWNADGSGQPRVIQELCVVNSAVFSPDEQHIVVGCGDNTLHIWKADGTGEPIVLRGHDAIAGVRGNRVYRPDGKRIVSSASDGTIGLWNADGTGEAIILQASKKAIRSASFSPDGAFVVVASDDQTVTVLRDLEPLEGPTDRRLWTAARYCLPFDVRRRWLNFSDEQSRQDFDRCQATLTRIR